MTNFASRISAAAMLAMAALPIVALAGAAHAETRVKVADINLLTPQGVATFNQRAEAAGRDFCIDRRSPAAYASCRKGVKVELNEKLDALRTAALENGAQTFAAR